MNNSIDDLPALKESELVTLGPCVICGKPQLGQHITFYKIAISRAGFDANSIRRRVGLEMMLGNSVLAQAMGPDEAIARVFDGPHNVFVHEGCADNIHHLLSLIPEKKSDDADGENAETAAVDR